MPAPSASLPTRAKGRFSKRLTCVYLRYFLFELARGSPVKSISSRNPHSLLRSYLVPALALACAAALGFSTSALAHHGFGLFDRSKDAVITGTI